MIGAIVVQTNPLYTERELEHQLNDAGVKVVIALDHLFKRVQNVLPKVEVEHTIFTSMKDYLPFPKNILYPIKAKKKTVYQWRSAMISIPIRLRNSYLMRQLSRSMSR